MCICKSSQAKRKRFHRRGEVQMIWWPWWCTKVVHQHGVSIQSSINLRETFWQITQKRRITETWDLETFFQCRSVITFHFLSFFHWTVSNLFFYGVTVQASNIKACFSPIFQLTWKICSHFGPPVTIYVAITFCPFVTLDQRALALALFHISQLNDGMRYQTVLEQVTLQSLKGTFREWLLFRHIIFAYI